MIYSNKLPLAHQFFLSKVDATGSYTTNATVTVTVEDPDHSSITKSFPHVLFIHTLRKTFEGTPLMV